MLRTGQVRVDGKRAEASQRLQAGQSIRVPPHAIEPPKAQLEQKTLRETSQLKKLILSRMMTSSFSTSPPDWPYKEAPD